MTETEDGVYKPNSVIAIASSFEGIFNNGAQECALTTFNAYRTVPNKSKEFIQKYEDSEKIEEKLASIDNCNVYKILSGEIIEPENFNEYKGNDEVRAFLALRPLVKKAFEYFFVIDAIRTNTREAQNILNDPNDIDSYDVLIETFNRINNSTSPELKKALDTRFYTERKRMQKTNYDGWLGTQEPFEDTINEMIKLTKTWELDEDKNIISGFIPRFATSKDEGSTYDLCTFYVKMKKLGEEFVSDEGAVRCIIPKDGIIGKETIPSREDVERMDYIADDLGLPKEQVWRMDDRYDPDDIEKLNEAGYEHIILTRGYTFPHDFEKANNDDRILVIENRGEMAKKLGEYAEEHGF
ncbi:MAG: hypothetical protein V1693_04175 [Nanoarchaeota archaeon]|nr:hypothetical protein [Nanoarchaeota archaeon]